MKKEEIKLSMNELIILSRVLRTEICQEKKYISLFKGVGIDCSSNEDYVARYEALDDKLMSMAVALYQSNGGV